MQHPPLLPAARAGRLCTRARTLQRTHRQHPIRRPGSGTAGIPLVLALRRASRFQKRLISKVAEQDASPSGTGSAITCSTCAPGGPEWSEASNRKSASGVPWASTSTRPSDRLRTQPRTLSACAHRSTKKRYPTPCTRPVIQNRLVYSWWMGPCSPFTDVPALISAHKSERHGNNHTLQEVEMVPPTGPGIKSLNCCK